jgi:hypothetical protein
MKITSSLIKDFEADQEKHGTKTAIFNLLWLKARQDLDDLGVTRVQTSTKKDHDISVYVS